MRKLLLFALLLPSVAQAGPLDWAKHHKRFLLMEGAAVAGASIHAYGLHHCRRTNGVEPCDEHYGSAWGGFAAATIMTVVVMPAVAEGCWKDQLGHFCDAFAYAPPVIQGAWGVHEARIKTRREER